MSPSLNYRDRRTDEQKMASLVGKTLMSVDGAEKGRDLLTLTFSDGTVAEFFHTQDCCESVAIEDVAGSFDDLIGASLTMASVATNGDDPPPHAESHTWTFYRFSGGIGTVCVRWLGESNGYYGEGVDINITEPVKEEVPRA